MLSASSFFFFGSLQLLVFLVRFYLMFYEVGGFTTAAVRRR